MSITLKEQYDAFLNDRVIFSSKIEKFYGVEGLDVYNPSIPFTLEGKTYIACRCEKRSEEKSFIAFFELKDGEWYKVETPVLTLQDPSIAVVDDKIILSGINVSWGNGKDIETTWKTDFYIIHSLNNFEYFASGPSHMKDIRILQLPNKKIAICGRPQGEAVIKKYGCIAKITFTIVNSLAEITPENIDNATILNGQFLPDEWGGANQLLNLENGNIGVVGHKSYRSNENGKDYLHYYGMTFEINPKTLDTTPTKIIISRNCFPDAPSKRPDLEDVTFTSGIVQEGENVRVYSGLSDAFVGSAVILNPFK